MLFITELRTKYREKQIEMAHKLGITSAYLSAIEKGRRSITEDLINRFGSAYNLNDREKHKLKMDHMNTLKISLIGLNEKDRNIILLLHKKLDKLTESDKIIIQSVIDKSAKKRIKERNIK